jgi:hypothetical protein
MSENTITQALRRMGYEKQSMSWHGFRAISVTSPSTNNPSPTTEMAAPISPSFLLGIPVKPAINSVSKRPPIGAKRRWFLLNLKLFVFSQKSFRFAHRFSF